MAKMKIKLEIIGDRELKQKLERLGQRAQAALVKANQAGAEPLVNTANSKAPGPNIQQGAVKVDGGRAESSIGPDADHWYYAFAEYGSSRHEITGSPLVFEGRSGRLIVIGKVDHPGHAAEPFLRPAADQEQDAARDAAGKVFWAEVEKEIIG